MIISYKLCDSQLRSCSWWIESYFIVLIIRFRIAPVSQIYIMFIFLILYIWTQNSSFHNFTSHTYKLPAWYQFCFQNEFLSCRREAATIRTSQVKIYGPTYSLYLSKVSWPRAGTFLLYVGSLRKRPRRRSLILRRS